MKTPCIAALLGLLLIGQAPGKTIPNHAIADLVLGQNDFTSALFPTVPSSFSLATPTGVVVDPVSRKIFVSDSGSNRVLRYPNVASLANGAGAEAVFGQPRFSSNTRGASDQGLNSPYGMFFDRLGRLWLADTGNNRVLMYEAAVYRETHAYPDRVYGQPDFTTITAGTTAAKMYGPAGVWVDTADRLWVAEYSNNRVLRFNDISSKPSGAPADGVLGQALFTTANAGWSGASGLVSPGSIAVSSSGTLFVVCVAANRVMRFDNAATLGNGAGASAVLGQPDFTTNPSGLSATQLNYPTGVTITPGDTLWVNDYYNNRCLRFEGASTKPSGSAADGVVGQPNFTTNTATTTNRGLSHPEFQPFVDATGSLWVPDNSNRRVLRFPPDVTKPLLAVTTKVPKSTTKKKLQVAGTASDTFGIVRVQFRIGSGPLQTATGTTSWKFTANLKPGKNKITVVATDSVGNQSASKTLRIERE